MNKGRNANITPFPVSKQEKKYGRIRLEIEDPDNEEKRIKILLSPIQERAVRIILGLDEDVKSGNVEYYSDQTVERLLNIETNPYKKSLT